MRYAKLLTLAIYLATVDLTATILNTKHNMSITGVGTVKATGEQEVCIFCHIPHAAQTGTPLWNRSLPTGGAYALYDSTYLRRINYPAALSDLGSATGSPGTLSRQCLGCHDGTVAIGSVYMVRGTLLGSSQISMSGVDAQGMMPVGTTNFGRDLRKHHPVGYEYTTAAGISFGSGSRNTELLASPTSPLKLYSYAGKNYVECSSCHDPHTETKKFLHFSTGANHAENVNGTCTSCHDKVGWTGSAHQSVATTYTDADGSVLSAYGTKTVGSLGCINCHTPHNGDGAPYLLRKIEENTCFQGAASSVSNAACHGTGGARDIQTILNRTYSHPVIDAVMQGKHTNLDVLYGVGVSTTPVGSNGIAWSDSKHAECMDCHNQHQAKPGSHAAAGSWYPTTPSNLIANSGPLTGASGVEPTWPAAGWVQPQTFTTQEAATKEYQVCMKCHSYWGLGTVTNGVSTYTLTHEGTAITDQAFEFNPRNRSAHPVVMTTNEMKTYGGNTGNNPIVEGRYAPPLSAAALKAPWNVNVGNQTMMCSDCHGADNEVGGDPKGPHGSTLSYMLKGVGKYWPIGPDGTYKFGITGLYTMSDGQANKANIFCLNCHEYQASLVDPTADPVHSTGVGWMRDNACVECHVAVPHGSKVSRLIGYASMPAPYNYNNLLGLIGFKAKGAYNYKDGSMAWRKRNAYTNLVSCASGASCHTINDTGYDTYP